MTKDAPGMAGDAFAPGADFTAADQRFYLRLPDRSPGHALVCH